MAEQRNGAGWMWRLQSWLVRWVLSLIMILNRKTVIGEEYLLEAIASNRPVFVGLWHGRLMFSAWYLRKFNPTTLVSRSSDGEFIAGILKSWGYRAIRGSSRRGGQEALRNLMRALDDSGLLLAVTMDGPLGPDHIAKPGSLAAAHRKGAILLPMSGSASRKWVFHRSWDHFILPKPFGRIVINIGEPVSLDPSADETQVVQAIAAATTRLENQADALTG